MGRILVVDDDMRYRDGMVPVLASKGFEIVECSSGQEALSILGKTKFDIVIVDGTLPDTNGVTLIREMREKKTDAVIIFISALWRDEKTYNMLTKELAVPLVLHKPVLPAVLSEHIDKLYVPATPPVDDSTLTKAEKIAKKLAVISAMYVKELPSLVEEVAQLLLEGRQNDQDKLNQARTKAHMLRGTAGLHGYHLVGSAMGRIDDSLRTVREQGPAMWLTDFWSDIDAAVKDARDGLRQPGASVIEDQLGIPLPRLELPEPDSTNVPTVLILDDDLSFVQAVEAALGEAGIAFEALLDSVRVFDALEKVNPDLLLLDLQMPGLSGFDVCRMVRESPQWQSLPIICVSGHSNAQVQTAVFQSGADDFIVKPFDKAELIARIHSRALRYRQSKAQ